MNSGFLVLLGLVVASVAAAALPGVLDLLAGNSGYALSFAQSFKVSLLFSSLACVFLGLPAFLILRRSGYVNVWSSIAGGGAIGLLLSLAFYSGINGQGALTLALDGAASGALFWATLRLGEWGLAKSDAWEQRQ